ncbi:hypothetical protein [Barnesiella sp. An55]|uniref:hypothetical protein n=1 Tax=Barnesiella sp. An55 TaxID=1965646 RepID=UPI000B38DB21|nr:hypothetical protein [Barnesiella sp. An55]OUN74368.1 hypothetical protein B5G10_02070 [Barnesiella sp. An55]HIZ27232.1 hypothetical protein [Candidatus Barnesiella merdipullorum]
MIIEKIQGTEPRLYTLVAPLTMSIPIIRQNNNYPFKTSRKHVWFVASDGNGVEGFMPVERRMAGAFIDNYYASGDSPELLTALVNAAIDEFASKYPLYAMAHIRHEEAFVSCGFTEVKRWKLYVKMKYVGR